MNPRDQSAPILTPIRLRELSQKSDLRGWLKVGSHIGAIAVNATALAYFWGQWAAIPLFMSQGILIVCLYAGVHELSHRTVFKTKKLNDLFGRLFSLAILVNQDADRLEHTDHHLYTNLLDKDAEIVGVKPYTLFTYLLNQFGVSYWWRRIQALVKLSVGLNAYPYLSPLQQRVARQDARLSLAVYIAVAGISIAFQSWAAVQFWLLPMFAMKFVHQLQNIVEHTGMPHVNNIMENTRTIKTNPVMRWLLWNMPYHTAHHKYPTVPFFRLPELHREIVQAMGHEPPTITYGSFVKHMIRKLIKERSSQYSGKPITSY